MSEATGHRPGIDASEATQGRQRPYADDVLVIRPQRTGRRSIRSRVGSEIGRSGLRPAVIGEIAAFTSVGPNPPRRPHPADPASRRST